MKRWWVVALASAPCWAAPAGITPSLGRWLGGLIVVLGLLVLSLWLLKRLSRLQASAGCQIRVVGGLSLGGRERLLVVEIGQTQLVLGVAPGRVQTLHVLEGEARLDRSEERLGRFKRMLAEQREKR
jgi:flagellar protein FliO/FliZ